MEAAAMIAPCAIADILGLQSEVQTMAELDNAIASGLPKQSVVRVNMNCAEWWTVCSTWGRQAASGGSCR
jgi:hypothetical protein